VSDCHMLLLLLLLLLNAFITAPRLGWQSYVVSVVDSFCL